MKNFAVEKWNTHGKHGDLDVCGSDAIDLSLSQPAPNAQIGYD
jgi:hypothetical protein